MKNKKDTMLLMGLLDDSGRVGYGIGAGSVAGSVGAAGQCW